jgi:hypothetical protein
MKNNIEQPVDQQSPIQQPIIQAPHLGNKGRFSKIKEFFKHQLSITSFVLGLLAVGLLITAGTYVLNSRKSSITAGSIPSPTQVVTIPPTATPSQIIADDQANTSAPISTKAPTPTLIPLGISLHLLEAETGNPIFSEGIKITLKGEGVDKSAENKAEAYFPLSLPGTYAIEAKNIPWGYLANEGYCSDNQNCRADTSSSGSCATIVKITQGKFDVYCKYKRSGATIRVFSNPDAIINSINPSSGSVGTQITLKGSGFLASGGNVFIYDSKGEAAGGSSIDYWSDTEIKFKTSDVVGDSTYQIAVANSNGKISNKVSFAVGEGLPNIDGIGVSVTGSVKKIVIKGRAFGDNQASVLIYSSYPTTLAQNYSITSWSNSEIAVDVSETSTSRQEYAVGIATYNGKSSSIEYASW